MVLSCACACAELFSAGDGSLPYGGAIPGSDQPRMRDRLLDEERELVRAHATPAKVIVPRRPGAPWRVHAWVLAVTRPRRFLKLECTLPGAGREEQGPAATVRDSVALTGLPYL